MPRAAVVVAGIDVLEKVRRRDRRLRLIDLDDDVAELGLDATRGQIAPGRVRRESRRDQRQRRAHATSWSIRADRGSRSASVRCGMPTVELVAKRKVERLRRYP